MAFQRWLGPELLDSQGKSICLNDVIKGHNSAIALYFSVEWAPNSQDVREQLLHLYSNQSDKQRLEIIFVSSDEDENSFQKHFEGMPWLAIPYADSRRRIRLSRQHHISSLPFLVILDSHSGKCLSRVSRETLLREPECLQYPWKGRSLRELLTTAEIIDPQGKSVSYEELKNGIKALYFSAYWCPPCKAFTPQLISTFQKIRSRGQQFEVIFVSSDRSEESWKTYHSTMPWLSIQWKEKATRQELAESLEVKGIPTLVLLDSDLSTITKDGRNMMNDDPEAEEFPWRSQSVEILKEIHMSTILDRPSLILFTDGEAGELQFGRDVLLPAAEEYYADHPYEEGFALAFFVAGEDDISERIREVANLDDVVPLLAIIDITEGSKYLLEEGAEISNATVHNFVTRYTNEMLTSIPFQNSESTDDGKETDETDDEKRQNTIEKS